MSLIDNLIARRKAFTFLFIVLVFLGFKSYQNIPREEYPDVQIPIVFVSLDYEGISPEDGEKLLLKPVEKEVQSITGVKKMTSYAIEGKASVVLEFDAGFDSDKAIDDVREKIDLARPELPTDIDEPKIKEIIFSEFPVLNVILTGAVNERALVRIARNLQDRIEEISEVLEVNIAGDLEETVEIVIDPIKLEAFGISFSVIERILNNNRLVTAGALISGSSRYAVKIPGLLEDLDDILELPLKSNGDRVVKVADIAEIKKSYKPRTSIARVNGQTAVTLEVSKRSGENVIATVRKVRELVEIERKFLPETLEIIFAQDSSARIMTSNDDLQNNIIFAVLLVLITLLFTVGLKPAFLVALSIPGTFVLAALILKQLDISLNIVVLFSLILSVGLLVDAAIVITEYADRELSKHNSGIKAFSAAVKRMALPIIISTITTLIVFMPLLFWPGVVGQFMLFIPLTLIITLSCSLLMALIFVPIIGSWSSKDKESDLRSKFAKNFVRTYGKLVTKVLHFPVIFALIVFMALISSIYSFAKFGKGSEFFPEIEPDNASINIRARGNLSIYEKDEIAQKAEELMGHDKKQITTIYSRIGDTGSNQGDNAGPADTIAALQLELNDWRYRDKAKDILADLGTKLSEMYGIIIEADQEKKGPASGKDIQIEVSSRNTKIIDVNALKLVEFMQASELFKDIEDSRQLPSIEWKFDVDRELAEQSGLTVSEIGNYMKLVTNGIVATSYRPDYSDDEVDIVIRFPEEYRNISQFDLLKAILPNGDAVPITSFITQTAQQEVNKIDRIDGYRVVTIKANITEGTLTNIGVKQIAEWLAAGNLSPEVNVKFGGEDEDSKETGAFLQSAFGIALLVMALILVIQFNSIYKMIIIISAAYLSTAGVLIGLLVSNSPFGIVMCGVGIISLAGIVVNNNIIFIDTYDRLRKNSISPVRAIVSTATKRLRPILLTSITTVLGLLPMVFSMNINFFSREVYFNSPSSDWWQQLSTTIASGLIFATILTLFFTPALLLIGEKCSYFWQKKLSKKSN